MNSTDSEQYPTNNDACEPLMGLATLMRMAFSGVDLAPLGAELIKRAERNPNDANALMDLSTILQLKFNPEISLATQAQALEIQQLYHLPASGPAGIRLLAIMGPGELMSNAPLEFLLEGSDVALDMLYVAPNLPFPSSLPDHDLVFVGVGESDRNRPLLKQLEQVMASWPRPVLNAPDRIVRTSRDNACALLKSAPGVVMSISARIERQALEQVGRGALSITTVLEEGDFPIIVRPIDSHAGRGLEKIDDPNAIADYLQTMPDSAFYVARFVDYRGPDGLFRKYRIVLIGGRPFAGHMGISEHWMIHYLNAGMTENAAKRAEEARFMADFEEDFARRHKNALNAIAERMALDYLVIDCAETADGRLLVFEVDTGAVIHAMDPVDIFPYKQLPMRKVFDGFREMLVNTIKRSDVLTAS
ncbi:MAG TPA: RimK family alpha-L-glutamate ligase [Betaproteobacteria bacterium]|nr:RimK family alpha-L-glutamate ligase [Betaproteobacteria bacterium]